MIGQGTVSSSHTETSILHMDAMETATAIRERQLTCAEAVGTYIDHLRQVNPAINALVEDRFSEAIEEAQKKDRQLASGTAAGELFGVPISVKEAFDTADMKTTGGLLHRRNEIAEKDAEIVRRLKQAGAIILGKTNTPELCFCQETDNKLYGRTNNPWDLARTAGGSSGGEGALLAAGGAAVGIGSDIGGSIRFPSHFNGVVGFKSGKFQVSGEGSFPAGDVPIQQRMIGFGPMGKSVRDMRLLYRLIAEQPPEKRPADRLYIDVLPPAGPYPISGKTADILNEVAACLKRDFPVVRKEPPYFRDSAQLWQEMMSFDGAAGMRDIALPEKGTNALKEFVKEKLGKRASIHPYLSWAMIGATLFRPSAKRRADIETIIEQGDRELDSYLADRILVFPVYHTAAPLHGRMYKEIFSLQKGFLKYMPFTGYANVWGLPSLVIPVGRDENNMPISVQLMSKNGNEELLFEVGELLEREFGGYRRSLVEDKLSTSV
ncbi:amidase [Sporosarcina sp. NCCP-2716]|uniref:amidase n=1 Tax=Sporosarcina sp. NCCP-2716 TaxID=2943679 RepID=UPI00203D5CAF|nr:amidase [Sporosarcina sp. NCCP-2716]GKV69939.1 amidase [Sporosarcina sp. NCCP-2716]